MSVQPEKNGVVERDLMLDTHLGHSNLSNMNGFLNQLGHRSLSKNSVQYHSLCSGRELALWDVFYRSPRGPIA